MGVAAGQQPGRQALLLRRKQRQVQHRPDAQGGTLRGIDRAGGAEEARGVLLAFPDHAPGAVQYIRSLDLRQIQGFRADERPPFMSRHMHADGIPLRVRPDKITDRCVHASSSCNAACSMIAHSMRLRNSSQPYLYTPRTEPVAW